MSSASADIEGRWPIPPDWNWRRAKDFAKVVGGGTPKNAKDPANYAEDGTPWITPADLSGYSQPTIGRGARSLSETGFGRSSAKLLPGGTVLVSSRAPVGYCAVASNDVSTNQGFRSLVLDGSVDPFFLRYYVLASRGYLEDNASGTTFKELPGKVLEQLLFPIPPIEAQKRIVARIDELFTELDDGEAALERARDDLETYRKSLLKAAVTGELTADWRAANTPQETGEQLLQRILAERKARWQEDPKNKGKRYKEPEAADTNGLAELPEGWAWASVAQLGDVVTGATPKTSNPALYDGDVPFFTPSDLDAGHGLVGARRTISEQGLKSVREIPARSVLVTCIGATIGKTGFNLVPGATNQQINSVVPSSPSYAEFIYLYFAGIGAHQVIERSSSTTLPILNKGDFSVVPVPLPPEAEALEIAKRALKAMSEASDLDAELNEADQSNGLRQSILAAAFKGELVQ